MGTALAPSSGSAGGVVGGGGSRRRAHRFPSQPLPTPAGPRLRSALAREHAREPFTPRDVRAAARRVRDVASGLGLAVAVVRGGVDVGGAELDHVWAVVESRHRRPRDTTVGHVVDVTLPLRSEVFVTVLRAYVAGDLDDDELDHVAHGYAFEWRVVGEFPASTRYVGLPVLGQREPRV